MLEPVDFRAPAGAPSAVMRRWQGDSIYFGGDYNPEQWPEETWSEDVDLMRQAGVNLVSVGIFSWALLEPSAGRFEFGWLDRVLDLLHDGGIQVDLATATASPPPWLARAHPETLPRRADGAILWPGGRQAYCPSSPVFRERSLELVRAVAGRYADHPAVVMWHVSNELRLPQRALLLRRQRRGVPRLAARALRRPGPAQRRLGHRVLEPALRRLGRDQPAAHRADLRQPHAAAGLPAVLLRRAARPAARRARGADDDWSGSPSPPTS